MAEIAITPSVIRQWRLRIVDVVTLVLFFTALPLLILNTVVAITDGNATAIYVGFGGFILLGSITFVRVIPAIVRSAVLVSIPYVVGAYWLLISGLAGTGRIYFIFVVVLSALLFSKKTAVTIWAISIATVGGIYIAFAAGSIPLPTAILDRIFTPATLGASWAAQALISIGSGTAVIITVGVIRRSSLKAEQTAVELQELNEKLETRVREKTKELQEQTQFLEQTQKAGRIGSFRVFPSTNTWIASSSFQEIFGTEPTGDDIIEFARKVIHPFDRDAVNAHYRDHVILGRNSFSKEFRIKRKDSGETRWVYVYGELERDDKGEIACLLGTAQDITVRKQAEQELIESEEKFRTVVENTSDGLVVFGSDSRIQFVSPSYALMRGVSAEQLVGSGPTEVAEQIHPEDRDRTIAKIYKAIENRKPYCSYEYRLHSSDEEYIWCHDRARLTYDDAGNYSGSYVVSTDISERKKLEIELEKFRRFVEDTPVGIMITDTDGTIEYVNPGFTRLTGHKESEAIGKKPSILKSGSHDPDYYKTMWETIARGDVWRGEIHNLHKDGSANWVQAVISPMTDSNGTVTHYIATIENIDDRKEMEQLKESIDHIMRHDLKNPLNAIVNVPSLLIATGGLSTDQVELLKAVEESGRLMVSMIDSSLDLLKMERGSYKSVTKPVDLVQVLRNVLHQNGVLLHRSDARVVVTVDRKAITPETVFEVASDKRQLYTMVSNLVVNAIEASPESETIEIGIHSSPIPSLMIKNSGTVPRSIRDTFFEKYATDGKAKGTGLGTYSAKLIADTLGYEISMDTSDEKNETVVTITMNGSV